MRPIIRASILLFLPVLPSSTDAQQSKQEVILSAQVWSYKRVFPLLDGLFQDVSNTQVSSLSLNPNGPNGSQVDSLTQSFQLQLGFNQMSALQNQSASQMLQSNASLQNSLVNQQGSLLQQQLLAQQALVQAQNIFTQAQAGQDAQALAQAQQAVTTAQNNVTSLAAQMTSLSAQIKAPTYTPSFAANPMAASVTPPVPIPNTQSTSGQNTPSFPATKQMDNEIELLWERLSRMMGALTRPDSIDPAEKVFLIQFDTGIFPRGRKHQLLDVDYKLSCSDPKIKPIVLDMFPRMAAVNITNTKYRDNSFGAGAVLAWLGIGINAGYNREHLRMSQMLGQSSYITGYGVGQDAFGWKFGIPLGDDQISADTKKTFALVGLPTGCGEPTLALTESEWTHMRKGTQLPQFEGSALRVAYDADMSLTQSKPAVQSIEFNRVEYDPAAPSATGSTTVGLLISLQQDLDQQETVSVNGTIIKRARDSFGRATSGIGSQGLLESSTLATNSWIPISSNSLMMNLDGSLFGDRFPSIVLAAPGKHWTLNSGLSKEKTQVSVSGREMNFPKEGSASGLIPSLAFPKATIKSIVAARWLQDTPEDMSVSFTVSDSSSLAGASANQSNSTSVQVITDSSNHEWSSNAEVYEINDDDGTMTRLNCEPYLTSGSRLTCDLADTDYDRPSKRFDAASYQIVDIGHRGGPIKGWAKLPECYLDQSSSEPCSVPMEWELHPPQFDEGIGQHGGWRLSIAFVNVDKNWSASFEGVQDSKYKVNLTCEAGAQNAYKPCNAFFTILAEDLPEFSDVMTLHLKHGQSEDSSVTLMNLFSSMLPVATAVDPSSMGWSGTGFTSVYKELEVQQGGSRHTIVCAANTTCKVDPRKPFTSAETGGPIFLLLGTKEIPLMQKSLTGVLTPVFISKTASAKPSADANQQTPTVVDQQKPVTATMAVPQ